MCSYNRVNGEFACEDSYLLTDVLKKDFNFKGFLLSDWGCSISSPAWEALTVECVPPQATHPRICRCNKRSRSRKRRIG
jgi:beta-glucosidase